MYTASEGPQKCAVAGERCVRSDSRCATSKFRDLLENEVKKRAEPERASGCKTLASKRLGLSGNATVRVFSGFSVIQ